MIKYCMSSQHTRSDVFSVPEYAVVVGKADVASDVDGAVVMMVSGGAVVMMVSGGAVVSGGQVEALLAA